MSLRRVRAAGEYADWVEQALFQVETLRECPGLDVD